MGSYLNVWEPVLVNKSNRPVLADGEYNILIRDNMGLYQGKSKILGRQNGRIYLTNKRIIYFDNDTNANCMALPLSIVSNCEIIEGFFRSSPKLKIHIRSSNESNDLSKSNSETNGTFPSTNGIGSKVNIINWACKICSYNNQISSNFDFEENDVPKCVSCGIRPNKQYLMKLLEEATRKNSINDKDQTIPDNNGGDNNSPTIVDSTAMIIEDSSNHQLIERRDDQCPTCTFINHPSMKYCELCGTELKTSLPPSLQSKLSNNVSNVSIISKDTDITNNPLRLKIETSEEIYTNNKPYIKLSFRKGGYLEFNQKLIEILDELKWDSLKNKGVINQNSIKQQTPKLRKESLRGPGIHGLELQGEHQRKTNEIILSNTLDDLEQLMFKYQDVLKLSDSFVRFVRPQVNSSKYTVSTSVIPPLLIKKSSTLYLQELSRHISEYSINFELTKASSMITTEELFANYNRYLVSTQGFGTELIEPNDFNKSIELFEELNLPIKLKRYEASGLVVISQRSSTDSYQNFILKCINSFEYEFRYNKLKNIELGLGNDQILSNEYNFFKGLTISQLTDQLEWSYNVTVQEVETCVNNGSIVIDQSIAGTFYHINKFSSNYEDPIDETKLIEKIKQEILNEQNNITNTLKSQYDQENSGNLINVKPDYTFGIGRITQLVNQDTGGNGSELESFRNTPDPSLHSQYESLNDLQGLTFE
ncbi:EAP30/Vps36 family-domain-containing protein [Scheffersomyces amazonensis]|uniref:EAP30/Vps36 family-domain-containing protein n=1 Tax=Scheffersomyces amazonensis TaxID=1078765 RepID=UPI00315CB51F